MKSVAAPPLGRGGTRAQPSRLCKQAGCLFPMPITFDGMSLYGVQGGGITQSEVPRTERMKAAACGWKRMVEP